MKRILFACGFLLFLIPVVGITWSPDWRAHASPVLWAWCAAFWCGLANFLLAKEHHSLDSSLEILRSAQRMVAEAKESAKQEQELHDQTKVLLDEAKTLIGVKDEKPMDSRSN